MSERVHDEAIDPGREAPPDHDHNHDGDEDTGAAAPVHATAPRSIVLYLVAFALLVTSVAAIGIGALLGFSTSFFWTSTLLSVLAIVAAGAAVLPARARSVD